MTATLTQTGLYAFDGVHVCHLTEGEKIATHQVLRLHYTPWAPFVVRDEHIDQLAADGWTGTVPPVDKVPEPQVEAEVDIAPEPELESPVEETKPEPVALETKPAVPAPTKKPAAKKR